VAKRNPDLRSAMIDKQPAVDPNTKQPRPRGREGKRLIGGHFAPEVLKQLRLLAAEQDRTLQDLIAEALNELFAKYRKPEIAPEEE